ncbi:SDR family oxidoreductase [Colwellia sp. BRX8-3]|nr:SDR family oxidoreductase [Colwellia sp. BRX9-1]MBA6357509.1 SDR family oxidoreductase [Colwellia sp. BRX8-3]MBA6361692.1 SDR family oxidoreductase [Colwellia sp. BRX8-6]MBA6363903.1 SDR family oxidoreductase [Colwellia sp. BRX8-8]MBA6369386.1 SDR family oxidoreductase [Colwellia sp. BRX8-5]MBA6372751.1 SDR family oxidoreductase [Colwellia sp. BRX8-4]MBA6377007.1 SDR family oxidoreductase [Colwellia sp. BRX8-2]MBA6384678.1 SDR family oxidoreductase [Colwellia sp. BRX10-9]
MNILVAGATGKTGQLLAQYLIEQGHKPTALVRESSDTSSLPLGVDVRHSDLTELKTGLCDGMDAVIFAAGSGGTTGPEMTKKVDRDGAKRLIDLALESGVKRFVMLSSIGADLPNPTGDLAPYLNAKHEADEYLKASGVTYSILRPVALTNKGRGTDVILGEDVDKSAKASRSDVAHVLVEAATTGCYDGMAQNMRSA